jgi:hypothetical protein
VVADTTGYVGNSVTLASAPEFSREGYALTGWNTQADGLGVNYNLGQDVSFSLGTHTLYAQWAIIESFVTVRKELGSDITRLSGGEDHE